MSDLKTKYEEFKAGKLALVCGDVVADVVEDLLEQIKELTDREARLLSVLNAIKDKSKARRDMHTCNWIFEKIEATLTELGITP